MSWAPGSWPALSTASRRSSISHAYRMHVKTEFPIWPASPDPEVPTRSAEHAAASTLIEAIAPATVPRAGNKGGPMKLSRTIALTVAVALVAGAVAALGQNGGAAAPADPTANVVDAAGHLRVPADYRILYQALGGWAIAADSGQGSKEMHAVYASPGAIDAYRKTGHFPDGAV